MRALAGQGRMAAIEEECRTHHGLSDRELMGRAAAALEDCLRATGALAAGKTVCLVAGRGNNGGDGFALAARLIRAGMPEVTAVCVSGKLSPECAFRLEEARSEGVALIAWPEGKEAAARAMERADILIDAVSGTGLLSPLRASESELCALWNRCGGRRIAIDIPSGFREGMGYQDAVFAADETLCIGLSKECLLIPAFRALAGKIRVLNEGVFPEAALTALASQALEMEAGDLSGCLKPFASDAYKYSRGNLSVYAGSKAGVGAARLCAQAALRSGAGLARLMVDEEIWQAAASNCGGLIVKASEKTGSLSQAEKDEAGKASCLIAGPGWGRSESRQGLLRDILSLGRPIVLDADALFALSRIKADLGAAPAIITPHSGEAARLLDSDSRTIMERPAEACRELANKFNCVALLKANVDWIACKDGKRRVFDASFPPLACAGSGDVLAGIAGGLLARGMPPFEAASSAVLIHYRAGRIAWESGGYFMAQDLCQNVSKAAAEAEGGYSYVR
jgi:ADP-dependent NAD(P)H-hydrate dehydratase / NAD(P)H-hydrate epimerase